MTTCLSCQHTQVRDPANLDRQAELEAMGRSEGLVCNLSQHRSSYHHHTRTCAKWAAAAPEAVAKRIEWFKRLGVETT